MVDMDQSDGIDSTYIWSAIDGWMDGWADGQTAMSSKIQMMLKRQRGIEKHSYKKRKKQKNN